MSRRDALRLAFRERRVAAEQVLLNQALRADRTPMSRLATVLVMSKIPALPPERVRARQLDGT